MKKSNYIISEELSENAFAVSSLVSGAVAVLEKKDYEKFESILNNPLDETYFGTDIYNSAIDLGFLIPDELDEISLCKSNYWKEKFDSRILNLTIIPTLACNLSCSYCYQKGFDNNKMSFDVADNIYKFIESKIDSLDVVSISWFGGEPLLATDIIIYINTKLVKLCNTNDVEFISSISTNSYALNENMIENLQNIGISSIQTTLAGTSEYHDKLRFNKKGEGSFNTIIKNIKMASRYWKIMICINLTKTNIDNIYELINYISRSIETTNIYLTFHLVESTTNNPCEDICLGIDEFNKKVLDLYSYSLQKGLKIADVTKFNTSCLYCSLDHVNSFSINYKGNLYKCTEAKDDDTSIGFINNNGEAIFKENFQEIIVDPYNNELCSSCEILPYCNGGCYARKKQGLDFCPSEKKYLKDYLKLFCKRLELLQE